MISIILPIYNAGKTIIRCLDSIVSQSYSDWEVLAIDDGSTDDTTDIVESYATSDARIHFHKKLNGGVGSARNLGLQLAKGEWITFIDSDDWLDVDFLQTLFSYSLMSDFVMSYPIVVTNSEVRKRNHQQFRFIHDEFSCLFTEADLQFNTSPWAKLYRKDLIIDHAISFDEVMRIGEDALFIFEYLQYASSASVINYSGYNYLFSSVGSLTKQVNTLDNELYTYEKIYAAIDRLSGITCKVDVEYEKCVGWLKGYYSRRVLNAIYHTKLPLKKRLYTIRCVDYGKYVSYLSSDSIKEKVLQYTLKYKMILVYDIIRRIAQIMR